MHLSVFQLSVAIDVVIKPCFHYVAAWNRGGRRTGSNGVAHVLCSTESSSGCALWAWATMHGCRLAVQHSCVIPLIAGEQMSFLDEGCNAIMDDEFYAVP